MSEYRIERINENSFGAIKTLYMQSFGIQVSEEKLRKKYDTQAFGQSFVGYLAYHDKTNEPAAYYGVFPLEYIQNGKVYLVAQSGDTMTAPNHQKKGLFIQLATETYKLATQLGIDFVFGFPNENSLPGFQRKLNWQFFDNMYDFSVSVSGIPLLQLSSKKKIFFPLYDLLTNRNIQNMEREFLFEISSFQLRTGIFRNNTFYQYKKNSGVHFIKMNGFMFAIKTENHVYVGDVTPFASNKLPDFIDTIKQMGKILYSKKVILTLCTNHWLYPMLSQKIEPKKSLPIGFLPINQDSCKNISFDKVQFSRLDYDTF